MNFAAIFILTGLLQLFAPWWVIALVPFLVNLLLPRSAAAAFWQSLLAVALVWLGYGFYLHLVSGGSMSNRIAEIFTLPNGLVLLAIATIAGGLVGGLAGLSGYLIRKILPQRLQTTHPAS